MHKGFRTRRTYAAAHRPSTSRSTATVYSTAAGEGILSQTCDGKRQGFTEPVVQRQRADGSPLFFLQSEAFPGRYYGLYQQAGGAWYFSGDAKLASKYIDKIKDFVANQQRQEVA